MSIAEVIGYCLSVVVATALGFYFQSAMVGLASFIGMMMFMLVLLAYRIISHLLFILAVIQRTSVPLQTTLLKVLGGNIE